MSKPVSNFKNITLSLLIISFVLASALSITYYYTKERIRKVKQEKIVSQLKEVSPPFNNEITKDTVGCEGVMFYFAKKDSNLVSTIIQSSGGGYSGNITLLTSYLPDGSIGNIKILEQKETPGLGTKICDHLFIKRFIGATPDTIRLKTKDVPDGNVDAITGATISSNGFLKALKNGWEAYQSKQNAGNNSEQPNPDLILKITETINKLFPEHKNNPQKEVIKFTLCSGETVELYPIKKKKIIGYSIKAMSKGYAGNIVLLVSLLPNGIIKDINILEQNETPTYGGKMQNQEFIGQFVGKNISKCNFMVRQDNGDIDAISGSTITSRAFCGTVAKAYDAYKKGAKK